MWHEIRCKDLFSTCRYAALEQSLKLSCENAEYQKECLQDKLHQQEQRTRGLYDALLVMVGMFEKLEQDPATIATPTPVRSTFLPSTYSSTAEQKVFELLTALQSTCLPETHPRVLQHRKQQQR